MASRNPHPTPFKKTGADANPNGRPKREWTVQGMIEDAMEQLGIDKKPAKKVVYQKLVSMAVKGDIQAIKEISNRLDGMPTQKQEVDTTGELIIKIVDYGINNIPSTEAKNSSPKV